MNKSGKTILASVQVVCYPSSHRYWVEVHPEDPKQQYRVGPFNLTDAIQEARERLGLAVALSVPDGTQYKVMYEDTYTQQTWEAGPMPYTEALETFQKLKDTQVANKACIKEI